MYKFCDVVKKHSTAESRWARFGPYYAMFPLDFAFNVVNKYSKKGDYIIDPFAGRGSSIFAGGVLGRKSLGIEINPVGWLYSIVKLNPAEKFDVIEKLKLIYSKRINYKNQIKSMPEFYRMCFCDEVLMFLLSARETLKWSENIADATLMATILVYLHGKRGQSLSNQMGMAKSMWINYSIKWWKEKGMSTPPEINPFEFLLNRIEWRYAKGLPDVEESNIILGDSSIELDKMVKLAKKNNVKFSLLFTSPPYCGITDYHTDQWLRLWVLGGSETPKSIKDKHRNRFESKTDYYELLENVFGNCSKLMDTDSVVYVRTDAREFTLNCTIEILKKHFSNHNMEIIPRPFSKQTQTHLFGDKTQKPGETDIILTK